MNIRNVVKIFLLYLGLLAASNVAITWGGKLEFGVVSPQFISRAIWFVIVLGLGWAVYDARVRLPELVRANPFFWALLVLAALSVIWSVAPMFSAKRVVLLAVMFLTGAALARIVSFGTGVGVLQAAMATMVIGSALVVWFAPEIGLHSTKHVGSPWKGLFGQKNWLGNAAALWGALCLALALSARRLSGVLVALAGIVVAVLVMWKSDSVTSYFGFAASVVVLLALFTVQQGWLKAWHLAVLCGAALLLVAVFYGELFRLFGRNESLTGRWSMWQTLWPIMLDRPLLGYGYDAYLYADGVVERLGKWKNMLVGGGNVHNGFIRLQVDVGLVGVLLGVGMFVQLFWRLVGWIRRREIDRPRYIAAGMWTVIFLHQIAEPSMFLPISLSVVLLVYTSLISYSPPESRPA